MDDYLQEEQEWVRHVLETSCKVFNDKLEQEDPTLSSGTFLNSANPAMVKRNVMASFGKALLMPVTIVPKTVAYSLNAVTLGTFSAVTAIGGLVGVGQTSPNQPTNKRMSSTSTQEIEEEVIEIDQDGSFQSRLSLDAQAASAPSKAQADQFAKLQLLLSLDVALQLIQADRDVLKRVQTFAGYPGTYGIKVRDTIEEVFIVLLQTLAEKHVVPGFQK